MNITKLEVKAYERFKLNPNLHEFAYVPQKTICLILGDNGSGKSSLMDLLLPKAVHTKTLGEGGYVRLHLTLEGIEYILSTDKDKGYSFIRDTEELNKANKVSVQEQLIESYLGINKTIHDLLIGITKFSKMTVGARRDLLEAMSGNDYVFVNGVYKKVYKDMMDSKSILAYASNKKVAVQAELENLANDNETLSDKIELTRRSVKDLMGRRNTSVSIINKNLIHSTVGVYRSKLEEAVALRKKIYTEAIEKVSPSAYHDIDNVITKMTDIYNKHSVLLEKFKSEHMELESTLPSIDLSALEPVDVLQREYDKFKKAYDAIPVPVHTTNALNYDYDSPSQTLETLRGLSSIINDLGDLDKHYIDKYINGTLDSNEVLSKYSDKLTSLQREHDSLILKNREYAHLKDHNKEVCPSCSHTWVKGYDIETHHSIMTKVSKYEKAVQECEKEVSRCSEIKVSQDVTIATMDRYRQAIAGEKTTVNLKPLIMDIKASIRKYPERIPEILANHKAAVSRLSEREILRSDIDRIRSQIQLHHDYQEGLNSTHSERINLLEEKIAYHTHKRITTSDKLTGLQKIRDMKLRYQELLNEVLTTGNSTGRLMDEYWEGVYQHAIGDSIDTHRDRLDRFIKLESKISILQNNLEDIEKDIKFHEERVTNLGLLTRILSPKSKLVATTIVEFINAYLHSMNTLIEEIWAYPLSMSLLDTESIKPLTYRFKISVSGEVREDVSQASTATGDLIDIVFRIVAMACLGLEDFPLYLDELGIGYDALHTENLCKIIERDLLYRDYSNVFIVAQDASIYDYFPSNVSDRLVLLDNNMKMSNGMPINQGLMLF